MHDKVKWVGTQTGKLLHIRTVTYLHVTRRKHVYWKAYGVLCFSEGEDAFHPKYAQSVPDLISAGPP